jgi:hypothetical protein
VQAIKELFMPARRKRLSEELLEALKTSRSIRQALIKAGLRPAGGNYATAHRLIKEHGLNTSHMTGQGWSNGEALTRAQRHFTPIEDILVKDSTYVSSSKLRIRLVQEGLKAEACSECGLTEWNGKQISLELDHMNGDRFDNRLENLRLLCPNCHAQTDYYRGRNIRNHRYM